MTAMIPLDAAATPGMETITNPLSALPKLSLFVCGKPLSWWWICLNSGELIRLTQNSWAPEHSELLQDEALEFLAILGNLKKIVQKRFLYCTQMK